jgi:prepilin-type processing-associated H-X9-DG protein
MQGRWGLVSWLLLAAVVASAVAAFGPYGILALAITFGVATFIRWHKRMEYGVLSVLAIVFCLFLLSPLIDSAGQATWRGACNNNLYQIARGLHDYHQHFGCFPPQYTADKDGRPLHSWRILILPCFGDAKDYKQYQFGEPWDGPNNSKFTDTWLLLYFCPVDHYYYSCSESYELTKTSYVAIVGPKTAWQGDKPVKLSDLPDGGRHTLLLVETANSNIDWRQPVDLTVEQAAVGINHEPGPSISSRHVFDYYFYQPLKGANVAFADGHVAFVPDDLPPEKLRALLNGDPVPEIEQADFDALLHSRPNWWNISFFTIFVISSLAFTFRPRARKQTVDFKNDEPEYTEADIKPEIDR